MSSGRRFGFGPVWGAVNNQFRVPDGDGLGGGTWEETGFGVVPMQWREVKPAVDVSTQSWRFHVDGRRYDAPGPPSFRGRATPTRYVDYLTREDLWLDRVRITEIPEPATLLLICGAAVPVLLKRRRL